MNNHLITATFAISVFTSALLIFTLEPLVTKQIVPFLGGSASVWNTALVFFQTQLLVAYLYVHFLNKLGSKKTQILIHTLLLVTAGALLPPAVDPVLGSKANLQPIQWTLTVLVTSVGLPFFVLASTAPLLQMWYSWTGHRNAKDPYHLYSASNAGALIALIAYPTLIEPYLGLKQQTEWWSVGFLVFTGLIMVSAAILTRTRWLKTVAAVHSGRSSKVTTKGDVTPPPWPIRLRWLAWSFVPSAMLLAVTLHISVDIASVPFLWIIPLAIYLLTFVIAFARKPIISMPWADLMLVWVTIGVVIYFSAPEIWLTLGLHVAMLFFTGLVCHLALAQSRPSVEHLTEFYLWIATGGWLGGVFGALIAPQVFNALVEYPILIVAAVLLRPRGSSSYTNKDLLLNVLIPVVVGAYFVLPRLVSWLNPTLLGAFGPLLYYLILVWLLNHFKQRILGFGLSIATLLLVSYLSAEQSTIVNRWRSFYGVYEASDADNKVRILKHGTTIHGAQALDSRHAELPITYFNHEGPLGRVIEALRRADRLNDVVVLGLGVGTIACHFTADEKLTFFEIDPLMERIASDPSLFSYLSRCRDADIHISDGRLGVAALPVDSADLIIMDAFSSDAIPVHLVTREAIQMYFDKLRRHGVLLIQISNRYVDLAPVVAGISEELGLTSLRRRYTPTPRERDRGGYRSEWMLVTRAPDSLPPLTDATQWQPVPPSAGRDRWTDDYSNLFRALNWEKLLWTRNND